MTLLVSLLLSLGLIGAYAILAVGIVMIYRASRVLNLAHGAMAMVPPFIVYSLVQGNLQVVPSVLIAVACGAAAMVASRPLLSSRLGGKAKAASALAGAALAVIVFQMFRIGLPVLVALPLGLVSGGLLGWGIERTFIRTLRKESETAQTVGTVAALGLLIAVTAKVWGTTPLPAIKVFPEGAITVGLSSIRYGELLLFGVMAAVTGGLIVLFQRTDIGMVMRGTAENRRAASLMGVDPDRVTGLAWILGGALAALSGIMLASVTNLHPYVLSLQALPAFVAALIAGLTSMQGAIGGAAVVGATLGIVPALGAVGSLEGSPQLILAGVAIAVMAARGRRLASADPSERTAAVTPRPAGARDKRPFSPLTRRLLVGGGVTVALLFPLLPFVPFFALGSANEAARYVLIATSLVVLTGWVGQISLGHAALVGVGSYITGHVAAGLGIPFPLSLPFAVASGAVIALILGFVAVRVRGLYLAVATLIFSWMASEFLFRQGWFTKNFRIPDRPIGGEGTFPFFDFSDRRTFYYVAWAVAVFGLYLASNLRDSKTGRAFFAVRGSEMAAASLGIDVVRTKLTAFALSGALAAAAGNLVITSARVVDVNQFRFNDSFFFLAVAVVGGLRSLGGAVAASILFASLSAIFFRVRILAGYLDIVSTGLLAAVLLGYREGLAAVPDSLAPLTLPLRAAVESVLAPISRSLRKAAASGRRLLAPVSSSLGGLVGSIRKTHALRPTATEGAPLIKTAEALPSERPADRASKKALIDVKGLTVRFGGLIAVHDVSLTVRQGEIVGLIGPNGAGKTVTFNGISGIVTPTEGRVLLHGQDVTEAPVHERAQLGLARTFQVIQLFGQLTVFENLMVATHVHNPSGLASHVFASRRSIGLEIDSRKRVEEVIEQLGLEDVAHRRASDLPFGILRVTEIARAMVTDFPLIMLDEATSGLDSTETDRLRELLLFVRELGVTLLLIEHDVELVTSMSDYMYVLDRGVLISEGTPSQVKNDPGVIAAYLGTPSVDTARVKVG